MGPAPSRPAAGGSGRLGALVPPARARALGARALAAGGVSAAPAADRAAHGVARAVRRSVALRLRLWRAALRASTGCRSFTMQAGSRTSARWWPDPASAGSSWRRGSGRPLAPSSNPKNSTRRSADSPSPRREPWALAACLHAGLQMGSVERSVRRDKPAERKAWKSLTSTG